MSRDEGLLPGDQTMDRRLELSVSSTDFRVGEKSWRLNQSPLANELICLSNEAFIKTQKGEGSEGFQVGEPEHFHMPPCQAPTP